MADAAFLEVHDRAMARSRRREDRAQHLVGEDTMPHRRPADRATLRDSRCTSRCRFTPAALACWPAITAKEASDLGVPLIGVGFMYPQGYFHQHVSAEAGGRRLRAVDVGRCADRSGVGGRRQAVHHGGAAGRSSVLVAVWRVRLGRVTLYLLDTSLEENAPVGP
jgi:hypothetical protein